jgi:hypothetical protein
VDPFCFLKDGRRSKAGKKAARVGFDHQGFQVRGRHESIGHGARGLPEERVVIATDIEDAAGFLVDSKLEPSEDFAELLPTAEASGKKDECIRQVSHESFPFVHGVDDAKLGQRSVSYFFLDERFGHDANGATASREYGICKHAHQSHTAAAEDQSDAGGGELAPEMLGCVRVGGIITAAGSAENAQALDAMTDRRGGSNRVAHGRAGEMKSV